MFIALAEKSCVIQKDGLFKEKKTNQVAQKKKKAAPKKKGKKEDEDEVEDETESETEDEEEDEEKEEEEQAEEPKKEEETNLFSRSSLIALWYENLPSLKDPTKIVDIRMWIASFEDPSKKKIIQLTWGTMIEGFIFKNAHPSKRAGTFRVSRIYDNYSWYTCTFIGRKVWRYSSIR